MLQPLLAHPELAQDFGGVLAQSGRPAATPTRLEGNLWGDLDAGLKLLDEAAGLHLGMAADLVELQHRLAAHLEPGQALFPLGAWATREHGGQLGAEAGLRRAPDAPAPA